MEIAIRVNLAENGDDRIIAVGRGRPILSLTVLCGLDHVNIACERISHFRELPVAHPHRPGRGCGVPP